MKAEIIAWRLLVRKGREVSKYQTSRESMVEMYESDGKLMLELLRSGVAIINGYFKLIEENSDVVDNEFKAIEVEIKLESMARELGYNKAEFTGHRVLFESTEGDTITRRMIITRKGKIRRSRSKFGIGMIDSDMDVKYCDVAKLAYSYLQRVQKNGKAMDSIQDIQISK